MNNKEYIVTGDHIEYRLAITYWREPRYVGIVTGDHIDEALRLLLSRIDDGLVMSFTVEGI